MQPIQRFLPCSWLRFLVVMMAIALLSACFPACSKDADYKKVDFTQKTDNEKKEPIPVREPLRVAVAAMISPKETFVYYRELIDYIGTQLNRETLLIQRKTYGEVNDLLSRNGIDLAFICSGPYVMGSDTAGFSAIATPVIHGKPMYQSYLIVHKDSPFRTIEDLKGKTFAFTDPDSNTGSLVPRYWLKQLHTRPEDFFRSITYTYSHDNAIMAVAKQLVDAAAVDGHYWEYYQQRNSYYSDKTRVIKKSEPFGSPPIVVSNALAPDLKNALASILLNMHKDPDGSRILVGLMIDRFEKPRAEWYSPIRMMMERLSQNNGGQGDVTP